MWQLDSRYGRRYFAIFNILPWWIADNVRVQTQSDTESDRPQPAKSTARVKVTFKNKSAFDGDDSAPDSLLDRSKEWLWRSYRVAYADLLSIWQLPIQQSEVLKIGTVADDGDDMQTSQYWSSHSTGMTSLEEPPASKTRTGLEGLDFQRHCTNCGHGMQLSIFALEPAVVDTPSKRHRQKPSTPRCPHCKPRQPLPSKLPCAICGEVMNGMLVPCLSCGHVCCFECHRRWFLDQFDGPFNLSDDPNTFPSCPTGCGCNCSEHIAANVPMPAWQPPSPNVIQETPSASNRTNSHDKHHRHRQSEPAGPDSGKGGSNTPKGGVGQHEDDLALWQESSPFASLARGMGGGLSQGLGTREERRKNRSVAIASRKGR